MEGADNKGGLPVVINFEKEAKEQRAQKKNLKKSFQNLWIINRPEDEIKKQNEVALQKFYSRRKNDEKSSLESYKQTRTPLALLERERQNRKFDSNMQNQLSQWERQAEIQA